MTQRSHHGQEVHRLRHRLEQMQQTKPGPSPGAKDPPQSQYSASAAGCWSRTTLMSSKCSLSGSRRRSLLELLFVRCRTNSRWTVANAACPKGTGALERTVGFANACHPRHDPSILGTLRLRLDSDIFAAARKTLDDDPRIPQNVRVHVDRGTVTLTGTVRWPHEKSDVEAVVRQIVGGLRVVHHIAVAEMLNPDAFEIPDPR